MDHEFDNVLLSFYNKLRLPAHLARFNPAPADEMKTYLNMFAVEAGNMLQSNSLLLSRVFIKNAKSFNLAANFTHHQEIQILDIGCKNAANLMGILAYLTADKVKYTGVDINRSDIADAQRTYQEFNQAQFVTADARKILHDKSNESKFDLVLIQHPNIESAEACKIFKELIINAAKVLANEGVIYITFFYRNEAKFFQENILPHMPLQGELRSNLGPGHAAMLNRHTGQVYFPENYSFLSVKKPGLKVHLVNGLPRKKLS